MAPFLKLSNAKKTVSPFRPIFCDPPVVPLCALFVLCLFVPCAHLEDADLALSVRDLTEIEVTTSERLFNQPRRKKENELIVSNIESGLEKVTKLSRFFCFAKRKILQLISSENFSTAVR